MILQTGLIRLSMRSNNNNILFPSDPGCCLTELCTAAAENGILVQGHQPWCGMLVGGQRGALQQPAGA